MLNGAQGLGFTFFAIDLATPTIRKLAGAFVGLDERVGVSNAGMLRAAKVAKFGFSTFAVGAAMLGGAFAMANLAGEFEQSIAAIGAISGASADELTLLHDAAIDAGISTQFSPTEATVGLKELAQAGFNAHESMKLLIPVLDLAAGSFGGLTPASAAGLAAQTMKAFGLSVEQASLAVDQMLKVNSLGMALKAEDLPLALGTAARGASTFHQSLEETLISLGLVKNVIPGVERASTAVAVAMERMVKPETQAAIKGIGVDVLTAQKGFRPFLDVLGDMAPALDKMTEAKRSAFLFKTFGGEALGGVTAILTQVTKGIRTTAGETLTGAAAFRYLRTELAGAGGTAAAFRDKMLNTFAGQKQLLRGSMETLGILLGEPLAQVFKPIVGAVVDALNALLAVLRATPMPVKRAVMGFLVGAAVLVTLVGAMIMAQAAGAWFLAGLTHIGIALGATTAVIGPAVVAVLALAAVFAGLYVAYQKNLGGIADFFHRVGSEIQLFFQGISQLVEEQGFSGAVMDELNKAENLGLKQFVIQVGMIAYRLQRIWEGFSDGFSAAIEDAAPILTGLVAAFREFGDQVAALVASVTGSASALPSDRFRSFGAIIGEVVGTLVGWLAYGVTLYLKFTAGVIQGAREMLASAGPAFATIGHAFGVVYDALCRLFGVTSQADGAGATVAGFFNSLGRAVGTVLVGGFTIAARVLAAFIDTLTAVSDTVDAVTAEVSKEWTSFADAVSSAVTAAVDCIRYQFSEHWTWLKNVAEWIANAVSEPIEAMAAAVEARVGAVLSVVSNVLGAVASAMEAKLSALFNAIAEPLAPIAAAVEAKMTALFEVLASGLVRTGNEVLAARDALVEGLTPVVDALTAVRDRIEEAFRAAAASIRGHIGEAYSFLEGIYQRVVGGLTRARDCVITLLRKIPAQLVPPELRDLAAAPLSTETPAAGAQANTDASAARAAAASSAMPAAAEAGARSDQQSEAVQAAVEAGVTAASSRGPSAPQVINLLLDGQVVAKVVNDANGDSAARSFSPVPTY